MKTRIQSMCYTKTTVFKVIRSWEYQGCVNQNAMTLVERRLNVLEQLQISSSDKIQCWSPLVSEKTFSPELWMCWLHLCLPSHLLRLHTQLRNGPGHHRFPQDPKHRSPHLGRDLQHLSLAPARTPLLISSIPICPAVEATLQLLVIDSQLGTLSHILDILSGEKRPKPLESLVTEL